MPRARLPQKKAEISGATLVHAGRFEGRKISTSTRPIGDPYLRMSDAQKQAWADFVADLPWLNSAHRVVLRAACVIVARMDADPDIGVQQIQALSSILSKLGATPVDETKVTHADGDDEEPEDKFFNRSH